MHSAVACTLGSAKLWTALARDTFTIAIDQRLAATAKPRPWLVLTAHQELLMLQSWHSPPYTKGLDRHRAHASAHHSTSQPASAYTAAELPHALSASALSYPQTPSPRRDDIERPQLKASAKATRKCRASNATK